MTDKQEITTTENEAEFLFYSTPDGKIEIEVYYSGDTIWLTQKRIAELFGVGRPAITKHLKSIFESGELEEDAVCSILEHTAEDGKQYDTQYYNLDAIISVGYRVNSIQATAFRKWATGVLKEYMLKGFAMDDERLKNGSHFGQDYFKELLERIREIRLSRAQAHYRYGNLDQNNERLS